MTDDAARIAASSADPSTPPPLPDIATLRGALRSGYAIEVDAIQEIEAGADAAARTWRCTAFDGQQLFVKLRTSLRPAAVVLPLALHDAGLPEPVPAVRTLDGSGWLDVGGWTAVVMPFIDAPTAMAVGLDRDGWRRLGAFAAGLHSASLSPDVRATLDVERFGGEAATRARSMDDQVDRLDAAELDREARAVRDGWLARRPRIRRLIGLSETLVARIRTRDLDELRGSFVTCHADLHAANVLVPADGGIRVVDWDEAIVAPRERDLMFVRGSVVAGRVSDEEADAFEAGYGPYTVDRELLAHYRVDWALQDVAGFAWEVLLQRAGEPARRRRARAWFEGQFDPGGQVDGAFVVAATVGLG